MQAQLEDSQENSDLGELTSPPEPEDPEEKNGGNQIDISFAQVSADSRQSIP